MRVHVHVRLTSQSTVQFDILPSPCLHVHSPLYLRPGSISILSISLTFPTTHTIIIFLFLSFSFFLSFFLYFFLFLSFFFFLSFFLSSFLSFFLSCQHIPPRHVTSQLLNLLTSYQPYLTSPHLTIPSSYPRPLSFFSMKVFETVQTITAIYPNFTLLDSAATSISRYITHTHTRIHTHAYPYIHTCMHTHTPYMPLPYSQYSPYSFPLHDCLLLYLPVYTCCQIHQKWLS